MASEPCSNMLVAAGTTEFKKWIPRLPRHPILFTEATNLANSLGIVFQLISTVFKHFKSNSKNFNHCQPFSTTFNCFQTFSIGFKNVLPFSAIFNCFQPFSTGFNPVQPVSSVVSRFQPFSTIFTCFKLFKPVLHRCYFAHMPRDSVSPICHICSAGPKVSKKY